MRRLWPLFLFVIIFAVALMGENNRFTAIKSQHTTSQRIISLSPSITETVSALGLRKQLIAVTDYCDFPADVLSLPKVGGFINPNLEAIVALKPDLVILPESQQKTLEQLHQLQIPTLAVRNTTLSEIKNTIHMIGQYTQQYTQAQQLLANIDQQINSIQNKTAGLYRPRVLISIGHSIGSEHIKTTYIAGQNDFYNDLITLAGGRNAYQGTHLKVPSLSTEGIMQLNPQLIFDIFPEADDHDADLHQVRQRWQNIAYIDAVKNNRVHIIEQNYATIPGPRIFLLLEHFARLIHPELDWESPSK
ncbi:MAG: helical backbone metal receptor [Gammaproteobacteria bacterium]|nr:helical backbone metal receptor [Gammaproteobacteria bacterium]MDH5591708.1 helical backbone metal receptor [Gammaproteobacteria bacterium]